MTKCVFCKESITQSTAAVSIVGGMFPKEEPDMFMVDEQVLKESYAHLNCMIDRLTKPVTT